MLYSPETQSTKQPLLSDFQLKYRTIGSTLRTIIQMSKYLLNNSWVFATGDDPDVTAALTAGFNINFKYTF